MKLRNVITSLWPKEINEECKIYGGYQFRLNGKPWCCNEEDIVICKRLISGIFKFFGEHHWSFYATCKLSRHADAKSDFFFRYDTTMNVSLSIICLSFNDSNKIEIVDGNECHVNAVKNAINNVWPSGIKNKQFQFGSTQFKLNGYPFFTGSLKRSHSKFFLNLRIIICLIENLQNEDLSFMCNGCVNEVSNFEDNYLINTLFFNTEE